jgi:phosphoribosylformylglycinamidine cyclo-ligase
LAIRNRKSISYRDSGVDIDAGNELVDRIKPAAAATARPGTMDALGGFGSS